MATVAHFDAIADDYGARYDEASPVGHAFSVRRRRVLEVFDTDGGRVLDVGCGPGVMIEAMLDRDCTYTGIDPSPRMVSLARDVAAGRGRVHVELGSAERIAAESASFDAVLCMGVLERIRDDQGALAQMVRVLRPGGALIVTLPHRFSPGLLWRDYGFYALVSLLRPLYRLLRRQAPRPVIRGLHHYDRRSIAADLGRLGCELERVTYCVYPVLPAPLDAMLPRLAASLMARSERLHRTPLRWLGAAIVVRARKPAGAEVAR